MKIEIDRNRCTGHARCNAVAADLFPLDDDGYLETDGAVLADSAVAKARQGASACPEQAIRIVAD